MKVRNENRITLIHPFSILKTQFLCYFKYFKGQLPLRLESYFTLFTLIYL